MSDDLDALRAELDAVDRELMRVAARRLQVVRRIGELKADSSSVVFDRDRERVVRARARLNAQAEGLPPSVGETLIHALIEAGHDVQSEVVAARQPAGRRVLILGGHGAMGRFLGATLARRGHAIDAYDLEDERDLADAVATAEVVVLSVPMPLAATMARRVAPLIAPHQLLCDINSLKEEVCAVYAAECRGEALGLHPMFGPSVSSLRRQKVVVCRVSDGPVSAWLLAELGGLGAELIETDPATHDRIMAIVQVLVHFRTLVMGEALRRSGVPIAQSLAFTSPIYRLELAVVGRLFTQDPDLYASIEMENPHGAAARDRFLEAARAVKAHIDAGDRDGFRALFGEVAAYFEGFGDEAMRLSDAVIDLLAERA